MEVAAITTVLALCNHILTWIGQLSEKEVLLKDVSSTVLQIRNILSPFTSSTLDGIGGHQLSESISGVGDALRRIDEHLHLYNSKTTQKVFAFLNPNAFIHRIKEDQTQLNTQLFVLLTAFVAEGYSHDRAHNQALVALTQKLEISNGHGTFAMDAVAMDAQEFWRDYIGIKVDIAANDLFCARLLSWCHGDLSKKICDLIIMQLDEFNSGVVTLQNLARALGKESLKTFVETYKRSEHLSLDLKLPRSASRAPHGESQLRVPLLVWVDDRPENNLYYVRKAQARGIQVIQLPSTAAAKFWVDENAAFLHEHDDASLIRFISDNVRVEAISESDDHLYPNTSAGQNFLQYLRGRLFRAPVLILTNKSIDKTTFVRNYDSAGSTRKSIVCLDYITSLADGVNSDSGWKGFKAGRPHSKVHGHGHQ
jgi:hypothetical protein